MAKRTKLRRIIWFAVLGIILLCAVYEVKEHRAIRAKIRGGLNLAQKLDAEIYLADERLFHLNHEKSTWQVGKERVNGHGPQAMDIEGDKIVFQGFTPNGSKICSITSADQLEVVLEDKAIHSPFDFSNNAERLAYFIRLDPNEDTSLVVLDLETRRKTNFPQFKRVRSVSWAPDGKTIFIGMKGDIVKLDTSNGHTEYVTDGHWPKSLDENTLGFWRGRACYKMDLVTKEESKVFETGAIVLGADWDPSGRYFVVSTKDAIHGFLLIPNIVGLPVICDTETGAVYWLPITTSLPNNSFLTSCVIWKSIGQQQ